MKRVITNGIAEISKKLRGEMLNSDDYYLYHKLINPSEGTKLEESYLKSIE